MPKLWAAFDPKNVDRAMNARAIYPADVIRIFIGSPAGTPP